MPLLCCFRAPKEKPDKAPPAPPPRGDSGGQEVIEAVQADDARVESAPPANHNVDNVAPLPSGDVATMFTDFRYIDETTDDDSVAEEKIGFTRAYRASVGRSAAKVAMKARQDLVEAQQPQGNGAGAPYSNGHVQTEYYMKV